MIVADLSALASARLGRTAQIAALAPHAARRSLGRYQPPRQGWLHGFRPGMNARLGAENTDPLVLGFPAAAFVPRNPDGSAPIPGTGGHVCINFVRRFTENLLPRTNAVVEPIPYPVHLLSLHIQALVESAIAHSFLITIPQHGFVWTGLGFEASASTQNIDRAHLLDMALGYDSRAPALLKFQRDDNFIGVANRDVSVQIILSYRHVAQS